MVREFTIKHFTLYILLWSLSFNKMSQTRFELPIKMNFLFSLNKKRNILRKSESVHTTSDAELTGQKRVAKSAALGKRTRRRNVQKIRSTRICFHCFCNRNFNLRNESRGKDLSIRY